MGVKANAYICTFFCGQVRHTMKNVWKSHVLSLLFIEQKIMLIGLDVVRNRGLWSRVCLYLCAFVTRSSPRCGSVGSMEGTSPI